MWADLTNDLRYALRRLIARPGFTLAVVLTLALGIGANVLVFDLIDGVYFRPLPYKDDAALYDIHDSYTKAGGDIDSGMESIPDYLDRRADVTAFADSALYVGADLNLVGVGAPERLRGMRVTPSLFSTLGVGAALGRTFGDEEAQVGRDKVAVISDALWRNRFNADPGIVGRDLHMDGESYRVIGVMPRDFMFPDRGVQLFIPFAFSDADKTDDRRFTGFSQGIVRLAPGATPEQAKAQSDLIVRRNIERIGAAGGDDAGGYANYVETSGYTVGFESLRERLAGSRVRSLLLIQLAVGLVLLIVCANIANLMLLRLSTRQKELSVRAALGASRARVVRQLLVEAIVLAFIGGGLGVVLALVGGQGIAHSGLLPDWVNPGLGPHMLASTLALSALAAGLFGLFPILSSATATPQRALHDAGRLGSGGRGARRTRNTLVVTQVALAVALLAGAGLLLRSFSNVAQRSPGFTSAGVLTTAIALPEKKYPDAAAQARALQNLLDDVRRLPGVSAAGLTNVMPFAGSNAGQTFRIAGRASEGEHLHARLRIVDEGYFAAMSIPVLRGRSFTRADWDPRVHNVIVDEIFARKHFPAGDAVGRDILLGSSGESDTFTIVGVVGTVKDGNLAADVSKETFYFDFGARPWANAFVAVRTTSAPESLIEPLRSAVLAADPEQPLFNVMTLDQRIAQSLTSRRVPMQLIAGFSALALLLAAIGLYGVLAFTVAQRTGELGVRMAIGADSTRILRLVLRDGAHLVVIGLGVGVLAAFVLGRLLRSQLFGVGSIDPLSLAVVMLVLVVTAFAACWLPARRAALVTPVEALRHE
jgi:predicted permease